MGAPNYGQSTCIRQTSQLSQFYRVSLAYVYALLINSFKKLHLINLEANLRPSTTSKMEFFVSGVLDMPLKLVTINLMKIGVAVV